MNDRASLMKILSYTSPCARPCFLSRSLAPPINLLSPVSLAHDRWRDRGLYADIASICPTEEFI